MKQSFYPPQPTHAHYPNVQHGPSVKRPRLPQPWLFWLTSNQPLPQPLSQLLLQHQSPVRVFPQQTIALVGYPYAAVAQVHGQFSTMPPSMQANEVGPRGTTQCCNTSTHTFGTRREQWTIHVALSTSTTLENNIASAWSSLIPDTNSHSPRDPRCALQLPSPPQPPSTEPLKH